MANFKGIVAHWAVTKYKCDAHSRTCYHYIFEGDGTEIVGNLTPEANLNTKDGQYCAHTLGCNTGWIGVSCAAMWVPEGFKGHSPTNPGKYPITEPQFEAMCKRIALLCKKYGIPVTEKTVLSHAEVQPVLGIKQRGKWDIATLPFAKLITAKTCGDYMRKRAAFYLQGGAAAPAPKPVAVAKAAEVPAPAKPAPVPLPVARKPIPVAGPEHDVPAAPVKPEPKVQPGNGKAAGGAAVGGLAVAAAWFYTQACNWFGIWCS